MKKMKEYEPLMFEETEVNVIEKMHEIVSKINEIVEVVNNILKVKVLTKEKK